MEIKIERLRTSQNIKNILTRIKGITSIQQWNIICRWGFCLSIKQETLPRAIDEKLDGVEMDYETLVGKNKIIYTQLLLNSLNKHKIKLTKENINDYLNRHINRGVNLIYNYKFKEVSGLLNLINF